MRYHARKSFVQIIGTIWLPPVTCAQEKPLDDYDLKNIREWADLVGSTDPYSRDAVEQWLMTDSRDFQHVKDFRVSISDQHGLDFDSDWSDPESELIFSDCMFPPDTD